MSATIHRLPTAASRPVVQHREQNLYRLAELAAARAQRLGFHCTVDDALASCRGALAEIRALPPQGQGHE